MTTVAPTTGPSPTLPERVMEVLLLTGAPDSVPPVALMMDDLLPAPFPPPQADKNRLMMITKNDFLKK